MPWSHCLNKSVFIDRLNWPYDSPDCLRSGGKLFHTLVPAAVKVLSPKLLDVWLTAIPQTLDWMYIIIIERLIYSTPLNEPPTPTKVSVLQGERS